MPVKKDRFEGIFENFDRRAKMLLEEIQDRAQELGEIPEPDPPKQRKPIVPFNAQRGPF
tara:strand:- start:107 stop:283 length:177 start_codon:yes stop_codon:yes gene_type:complete